MKAAIAISVAIVASLILFLMVVAVLGAIVRRHLKKKPREG